MKLFNFDKRCNNLNLIKFSRIVLSVAVSCSLLFPTISFATDSNIADQVDKTSINSDIAIQSSLTDSSVKMQVDTSSTSSVLNNSSTDIANYNNVNIDAVSTYSPSCILIDASSGKILYAKNSQEQRYPASTTKIMTAILTIENCSLDEMATVSHDAVFNVPYSYSSAYLKEGEQFSVGTLLDALLIPSANDAAFVLAEHVGGSTESFATMMNTKALDLGCISTNFINPNGIHSENHYSCAYDLALIGRYAMQNETFRNIVTKTRCSVPATAIHTEENRVFTTTNELIKSSSTYYYQYCNGTKTGYTDAAKSCIVASAKKDNLELIAVVLGGQSNEDGSSQRNLDCKTLFEYGFNNYSMQTIATKASIAQTLTIANANSDTKNLNLLVQSEISALVPSSYSISDINPEIELVEDLKAPIMAGSIVGKVSYTIDGITYSSNLISATNVESSTTFMTVICIVGIVIILYFIFKLTKPTNTNNKKYNVKKSRKSVKKSSSNVRNKSSNKAKSRAKHIFNSYRCSNNDSNFLYW